MLNLINKIVSIFPKPLQDLYHKYEDLILYLIFGVLTTIVSLCTQWIVQWLLSLVGMNDKLAINVATLVSWIFSVTFAFFTNKKYVFKSVTNTQKAFWTEVGSFYSARLVSLGIELVIMNVFANILGFNDKIVKVFAQVFIVISNYIFSKLVVFKNRAKQ